MQTLLKRFVNASWHPVSLALAFTILLSAGCSKSSNVEEVLASADRHYEKREFEAAKIQYINVLRAQGTNTYAMMRLGRIFFEQGQAEFAFPLLLKARDAFPDEIPLREALAVIYSLSGTNLWEAEVEALLQRDPGNETAITTLLRAVRSPEDVKSFTSRLATLRARAGDRSVFHLAEGELARREGDKAKSIAAFRQAIVVDPTSVSAHSTLGSALLADGQQEEGLAMLAKAAELSPPHGLARLRLAQALLIAGKTPEAVKILDELNTRAPEVIPAWSTRAEIALVQKDYAEARRLVSRALSQSPSDPQSLRVRAKIDLAENKPVDAVQALDTVAKRLPGAADVHYQLGIALLLNREMDRAIGHLEKAVELNPRLIDAALLLSEVQISSARSDDAISGLTAVIRQEPELGHARMLLARAYRAKGRLDDAINTYSKMVEMFPTNATPALQLGIVLSQRSRTREAREAFEKCLQISPKNSATAEAAFEQLVKLDVQDRNLTGAIARVEPRLRETPNNAFLLLMKANLLRRNGDVAGSEATLRRVLEIEPDSQRALVDLAQLYITTKRKAEALAELSRAVEKAPDNFGALTLIGMLHSEDGKYEEARASYESALKVIESSMPARPKAETDRALSLVLNNLAFVLAEKLGDLPGGHDAASRARRISPNNPVIADTLGWIEYRRGNYSEALRLLIEAEESVGSNPEIQFHLGMAHYMMGQEVPAREALREALKATEPFEGKAEAQTHLAVLELPIDPVTPDSVRALEQRTSDAPTDVVALARLANAYAASGELDKAIATYEAAIKANSKLPELLSRLALLTLQKPDATQKAIELARQARQLAPASPSVGHAAGLVAFHTGDYPLAFGLLQESAGRLPSDPTVHHDFALAAYAMGQVDQAVNVMTSVSTNQSSPQLAQQAKAFLQVLAFAARPSTTSLPPALQEVLKLEPTPLHARFASARLAEVKNNTEEARKAYEAILSQFAQFIPASRQLALILSDTPGAEAKAYDLALKVRTDLPRDPEIAASLGKLACQRGDFRFSAQLLTEAVASRPADAASYFHLGVAQIGLRKPAEAKAALEKAIATQPNAPFTAEAKQLLSGLSAPTPP